MTVNECVKVSKYLSINQIPNVVYHGKLTEDQQEQVHQLWCQGEVSVMVATSAFGMGVDYGHVRLIIIYGGAYSLVDLWQQLSRAGRDGHLAQCIVMTCDMWLHKTKQSMVKEQDNVAQWSALKDVQSFMNNHTQCRVQYMARFIHDADYADTCISDDQQSSQSWCDNCIKVNLLLYITTGKSECLTYFANSKYFW